MSIECPKYSPDHPDRVIDCEIAMQFEFHALAHRAIAAGWTVDDVSAALLSLARNHIKGTIADRSTATDISVAKQLITAMKGKN